MLASDGRWEICERLHDPQTTASRYIHFIEYAKRQRIARKPSQPSRFAFKIHVSRLWKQTSTTTWTTSSSTTTGSTTASSFSSYRWPRNHRLRLWRQRRPGSSPTPARSSSSLSWHWHLRPQGRHGRLLHTKLCRPQGQSIPSTHVSTFGRSLSGMWQHPVSCPFKWLCASCYRARCQIRRQEQISQSDCRGLSRISVWQYSRVECIDCHESCQTSGLQWIVPADCRPLVHVWRNIQRVHAPPSEPGIERCHVCHGTDQWSQRRASIFQNSIHRDTCIKSLSTCLSHRSIHVCVSRTGASYDVPTETGHEECQLRSTENEAATECCGCGCQKGFRG